MSEIQASQAAAEATPAHPGPGYIPTVGDRSEQPFRETARRTARRANDRIRKMSWPEVTIAALAGFAVGYLLAAPRRNPSLREIFDDSIFPWASRNLHDAADSVRHSRPVNSVRKGVSRIKAS